MRVSRGDDCSGPLCSPRSRCGGERREAQLDFEASSGVTTLQFNFTNPGARSLGLAGALTGAGDDATGAWTNPAGLTHLTRPEVGVELRGFAWSTLFVNGGRFNGLPLNLGVDTITGVTMGDARETTKGLSYLSVVVPRSRLAFAASRTEVANFRTASATDCVFFEEAGSFSRLLPVDATLDVKITAIGGAVAWRAGDHVSLGVGLSVYDLSLSSVAVREAPLTTQAFPARRAGRPGVPPRQKTTIAIGTHAWSRNPRT